MVDERAFEGLLESLWNEIDELPEGSIKNNLEDIHGALYGIFEDVSVMDCEKIHRQHEIMTDILKELLSHEDKLYYRMRYGIDLGV